MKLRGMALTFTISFLLIWADESWAMKDYNLSATGGTGVIIYPSLEVSKQFEIGIGGQVVALPDMAISPKFSLSIQGFNLGIAFDYATSRNGWPKPLMFSTKYVIQKGLGIYGDLHWNIDPNNIAFSFMLLGGEGLFGMSVGGGWDLTFGFGVAFTPTYDWNLNVFFAIQKAIYSDVLFLKAELANYSYRVIYEPFFANDRRGICNLGLNIVPANWITIGINGLDLLDNNRSLSLNLNFRFNV
ncbi:MAG: hypothetical protein ABDH28_01000 [Brevinematia bacterium]